MTTTAIFHAKVVSGVILYLGAVAPSSICMAIWAAIPGNIAAPFYWSLTIPLIADIACVLVYNLAGLMIGLRHAHWFGSRYLPLGVAAWCSLTVVSAHKFWQALIATVAVNGSLRLSAWICFFYNGIYGLPPPAYKLSLGISILAGFCVAAMVASVLMAALLVTQPCTRTQYRITNHGRIIRMTLSRLTIAGITDISSNPIEEYDISHLDYFSFSEQLLGMSVLYANGTRFLEPFFGPWTYREQSRYIWTPSY